MGSLYHQFNQNELTQLFKEASVNRPLYHNKNLLIFYSAHQVGTAPVTIVMHVNHTNMVWGIANCIF